MIDFISKVLSYMSGGSMYAHGDFAEEIWWRTDTIYSPVTFFMQCNDLFYWACSDAEVLTPENIDRLDIAIKDVKVAMDMDYDRLPKDREFDLDKWTTDIPKYASILFCARERKMRPQLPYYEYIPKELHELFNACGPGRTGHEDCCEKKEDNA